MDILIEFLLELVFEGVFELSRNKKINKWIRYPMIVIVTLSIIAIIGGLLTLGIIFILKNTLEEIIIGIFLIIVAILLIFSAIKTLKENIKNK